MVERELPVSHPFSSQPKSHSTALQGEESYRANVHRPTSNADLRPVKHAVAIEAPRPAAPIVCILRNVTVRSPHAARHAGRRWCVIFRIGGGGEGDGMGGVLRGAYGSALCIKVRVPSIDQGSCCARCFRTGLRERICASARVLHPWCFQKEQFDVHLESDAKLHRRTAQSLRGFPTRR